MMNAPMDAPMDSGRSLTDLQTDFLAGSSTSMPLVGTLYWLIVGIASVYLPLNTVAYIVLIGSGMIMPGGLLLDKLRNRGKPKAGDPKNPLLAMFLKGTAVVLLTWPLVIIAAQAAADPGIIVLGGAVLMALVWIPYGSAANDPVGLQHAVGRSLACYLAFWFAPAPYKATAVSAVVVASYLFTFLRMKRPA